MTGRTRTAWQAARARAASAAATSAAFLKRTRAGAWTTARAAAVFDRSAGWPRRLGSALALAALASGAAIVLLVLYALVLVPFTPSIAAAVLSPSGPPP